jgi:hypothetical protein
VVVLITVLSAAALARDLEVKIILDRHGCPYNIEIFKKLGFPC